MDLYLLASDACGGLGPIIAVLKNLFNIIKILVPIFLLIMGVVDLSKAVLASDDKEIKAAQSKLVKRAIAAVAVFFAVTLVNVIMGLIGSGDGDGTSATDWAKCWENS